MTLLANIFGRLRRVVAAAMMFAFLGASLTAAHALPCPDLTNARSASASGSIEAAAAMHTDHHDSSKNTDRISDGCCKKSCAVCVSIIPPAVGYDGVPTPPDHPLPPGTRSAGISVGPPHGPPRS